MLFQQDLQFFIINASMVGLAITLSLYSFILPHIREVFQTQTIKLRKANEDLEKISIKFSNLVKNRKFDQNTFQELIKSSEDVSKQDDVKFRYSWGFLITGVLFSISLLFPLANIFLVGDTGLIKFIKEATQISPLFLMGGVIALVIIWFLVFIDLKNLLKKQFEEEKRKSEEEIEKAKKLEEESKELKEKSSRRRIAF